MSGPRSRRDLIRAATLATLGGGAAAFLAACGAAPASPTAAPAKPAATTAPAPPAATAAPAPTTAPAAPTAAAKPAAATTPAAPATIAPVAKAPAGGKPEAQLRLIDQPGSKAIVEERIAALTTANPGITVKIEFYPRNEVFKKTQALLAANQMGDLVISFNSDGTYGYFVAREVLRSVDDYIAQEKFDLGQFYPEVIAGFKIKGKIWGLPFKGHPGASNLFYNETLFAREGTALPTDDWTWGQAIEAATRLTKGSGARTEQFGLVWPNTITRWRNVFQTAAGAEIYSEDGKRSLVNSEAFIKAVEWMHDLQQVKKVALNPSQLTGSEADLFVAGKVGMLLTLPGQKSMGAKIKDQFKWMVALGPRGHNDLRGPIAFLDSYSITTASKAPEAAWEVVKWMANQETGIRLGEGAGFGQSGTSGGRPDVYTSPRLLNHPDYRPEAHRPAIKAMELLKPCRNAWNYRDIEVDAILGNRLEAIWIGKERPTKAYLDTVSQEVQAVLDKPLPS